MHIASIGWDIEGLRCNVQVPEIDVGRCPVLILHALLNLCEHVKSSFFQFLLKVTLAQVSLRGIITDNFACKHLAQSFMLEVCFIMKICCPLVYNRN